jgi:hypothetical protein
MIKYYYMNVMHSIKVTLFGISYKNILFIEPQYKTIVKIMHYTEKISYY